MTLRKALHRFESQWLRRGRKNGSELETQFGEDLFSRLGGEIAFEVDSLTPDPAWKVMLQVNDPGRLQATLDALLAAGRVSVEQSEEAGVTYHTLHIPSARKPLEISYAFVDGYLIVASSHNSLAEAIRLHRSGESLSKSAKFLASLPPGQPAEASALLYEDPAAVAAMSLSQISPETAESLFRVKTEAKPVVACAYGEPSALREVSRSGSVDAGAVPGSGRHRDSQSAARANGCE